MEISRASVIDKISADIGIVMVIGRVDTGKSTFCRQLAFSALERGRKVAIVDSDVGQSWIGPPTTVGMKMVVQDFTSALFPDSFYFVGSISPERHLLQIVVGVKRMIERAIFAGADLVIVDTTGLIDGNIGRVLKTSKIDLVKPDHLVCFQRGGELDTLVKGFETVLHVHRLRPSKDVIPKSQDFRRNYRQKQFDDYFSEFVSQDFNFSQFKAQKNIFLNGRRANISELSNLSDIVEDEVFYAEWSFKGLFIVTQNRIDDLTARKLYNYFNINFLKSNIPEDFQKLLVSLVAHKGEPICLAIIENIDFNRDILTLKCNKDAVENAKIIQFSDFRFISNTSFSSK